MEEKEYLIAQSPLCPSSPTPLNPKIQPSSSTGLHVSLQSQRRRQGLDGAGPNICLDSLVPLFT